MLWLKDGKIALLGKRKRGYNFSHKRKNDNLNFVKCEKTFNRTLSEQHNRQGNNQYTWNGATHSKLFTHQINEVVNENITVAEFLSTDITFMIPRNKYFEQPRNYISITHLPTLYKLITSILTMKVTSHLVRNSILIEDQKVCSGKSQGCKEKAIFLLFPRFSGPVNELTASLHLCLFFMDRQLQFHCLLTTITIETK